MIQRAKQHPYPVILSENLGRMLLLVRYLSLNQILLFCLFFKKIIRENSVCQMMHSFQSELEPLVEALDPCPADGRSEML